MKHKIIYTIITIFIIAGCNSYDLTFPAITYKVTGTTNCADVIVSSDSGGTEMFTVSVPWQKTYAQFYKSFVYVSAQNNNSTGSITVSIYEDGKYVKSASSSGAYCIATASCSIGY